MDYNALSQTKTIGMGLMKTIIVHKPKRCRNPRIEVFEDHIDKINNVRSKKYLPQDTEILHMGMGGENLFNTYIKKYKHLQEFYYPQVAK